ncbi:hypothetical protein MMC30_007341 [Trapelia coarctata]|nr:hypothetical protein [Trapelia coarctata]
MSGPSAATEEKVTKRVTAIKGRALRAGETLVRARTWTVIKNPKDTVADERSFAGEQWMTLAELRDALGANGILDTIDWTQVPELPYPGSALHQSMEKSEFEDDDEVEQSGWRFLWSWINAESYGSTRFLRDEPQEKNGFKYESEAVMRFWLTSNSGFPQTSYNGIRDWAKKQRPRSDKEGRRRNDTYPIHNSYFLFSS